MGRIQTMLTNVGFYMLGQWSPYRLFEEDYKYYILSVLTKAKFPYFDKINEATLHMWENGFLWHNFWVNDAFQT